MTGLRAMFGSNCISSSLVLLYAISFWSTVAASDGNAFTDSENQYLFDRLLNNLRSAKNRQTALSGLIQNYFPVDHSASNKHILLQVLAKLGNVPFNFGGPTDDPSEPISQDMWNDDDISDNRQNMMNDQLGDWGKRWGSGPGPRGKRFTPDNRDTRRDGPGPRGKRQGPRGKKQGPRGKKEENETELYCLQTIANTRYLCDCNDTEDTAKCEVVDDEQ